MVRIGGENGRKREATQKCAVPVAAASGGRGAVNRECKRKDGGTTQFFILVFGREALDIALEHVVVG